MVYCGKPSVFCDACRKRRSRRSQCDLLPNGCTQCKNAGRTCPGYRRLIDVLFRDESAKTISRVEARQNRGYTMSRFNNTTAPTVETVAAARRAVSLSASSAPTDEGSTTSSLSVSLSDSVDERAKCFFICNFGGGLLFGGFEGSQDSMSTLDQPREGDEILETSMKAAGLLCYANYTRSNTLRMRSFHYFADAIQITNRALSSPEQAKKDSTLLSINLLGLFEMLNGNSKQSMKDWAGHTKGAATLLQLRGYQQFRSAVARRAFLMTTSSMMKCCLQWDLELPRCIIEMTHHLISTTTSEGSWDARPYEAMLAFCQFRHQVRKGAFSNSSDVVDGALEIDKIFAEVTDQPVERWQYVTVVQKNLDRDLVYEGQYHIYKQRDQAAFWNYIRVFRILIHGVIYKTLANADSPDNPHGGKTCTINDSSKTCQQPHESTHIIERMSNDILGSVPHSLGLVSQEQAARDVAPHIAAQMSFTFGHSLLWPLWIAGACFVSTARMRAYSAKVLDKIGGELGIGHASVFAALLKENADGTAWK